MILVTTYQRKCLLSNFILLLVSNPLLFLAQQHHPFSITCPPQIKSRLCQCYNDDSISCINAGFNEVPINLLPFAKSFNFDDNRITTLDNLVHPKPILTLSERSILIPNEYDQQLLTDIDNEAGPAVFNNVRDLHVSRNRLRALPRRSFWRLQQLEQLSLRYNYIQDIEPDAFYGLQQLKTLDLRNNKIGDLPSDIFATIPKVKAILLSGNVIKRLDPQLFAHNSRLRYIHLHQNPLDCTCFSTLYRLFQRPNTSLTGTCASPFEVSGAPLAVAFDRLACNIKEQGKVPENKSTAAIKPGRIVNDSVSSLTAKTGTMQSDFSAASNVLKNEKDAAQPHFAPLAEQRFLDQTRREAAQRRRLTRQLTATVNSRHPKISIDAAAASPVSALPHFVHPPQDVQVRVGEPVNLRCRTNGYPKPESEWTKDSQQLRDPSVTITDTNDVYIRHVTSHHAGTYTCRAWNAYGVSEASATVHVMVPPVIVKRPAATSTANEGDLLTMSCIAEGLPRPQLTWTVNGRSIPTTTDHNILNDGQQVRIERVTLEDAGEYHCTAQNSAGTAEVSGVLIVVPRKSRANLLVNNNNNNNNDIVDQRSAASSAFSMFNVNSNQFQRQSSPSLALGQVSTFATNKDHFSPPFYLSNAPLSTAKSAFIADDISRRFLLPSSFVTSASNSDNVLTNRRRYFANSSNNGSSYDGGDERQQTIENVVARARYQIERSVVRTIDRLKQEASVNPSTLFTAARFPSGAALDMAVSTDTFYRALELWRQQNPGRKVSDESVIKMARESGCGITRPRPPGCSSCYHRKYRSFDGTCNNREHPLRGAALTPFLRRLPADYEEDSDENSSKNDVHYHPQGWNVSMLYHGFPKPSARIVSVEILAADDAVPDPRHSLMLMQWGQFLDHDLDFALPSISQEQYSTGEQCGESCKNEAPCFPIPGHQNDSRVNKRQCIEFTRNSGICQLRKTDSNNMQDADDDHLSEQHNFWTEDETFTASSVSTASRYRSASVLLPRQQINQITSYIDASNVYGSDEVMARYLKTIRTGAFLRTGPAPNSGDKPLLPLNDINNSPLLIECRQPLNRSAFRNSDNNHQRRANNSFPAQSSSAPCFLAGDPRANEQLGLLATHTIFVRHHNYVAETLLTLNPHWDGERVYQETRKILGAQMQHITFAEWLPIILGEQGMRLLEHDYAGYDPGVDASISHAFMIAFRFGHTLIPPVMRRLNASYQTDQRFGDLLMHEALFAPYKLVEEGGVDPLLRGLIATPAKLYRPDSIMTTEVTENLFRLAEHVALDLGAMNLQRGRDHGLLSYMEWRRFCNISAHNAPGSFEELRSDMKTDMIRKLRKLYGHPDNIDLFAGATSETPLPGSIIGPTLMCIVADQFRRTRSGDRFWHENDGQFTFEQLQQIRRTNLARIICDHSDTIKHLPRSAFLLPQSSADFAECASLPTVDYGAWKECCDACYLDDNDVSDTFSRASSSSSSTRVVTNHQAHVVAALSRTSTRSPTQQGRRLPRQWLQPITKNEQAKSKNDTGFIFSPDFKAVNKDITLSARMLQLPSSSSLPPETMPLDSNKIAEFNACVNTELNEFRRRIVQAEQLLSSSITGAKATAELDELRRRLTQNELLVVALTSQVQ